MFVITLPPHLFLLGVMGRLAASESTPFVPPPLGRELHHEDRLLRDQGVERRAAEVPMSEMTLLFE